MFISNDSRKEKSCEFKQRKNKHYKTNKPHQRLSLVWILRNTLTLLKVLVFLSNEYLCKRNLMHIRNTFLQQKGVYFSVDEDQRQQWGRLLNKYKSINKMRVFVIKIYFNSTSWRKKMCLTSNTLYSWIINCMSVEQANISSPCMKNFGRFVISLYLK